MLCALYGGIPYAVAPPTPAPEAGNRPALPLGASEIGACRRTVTANVFVYTTIAVALLAAIVYVPLMLTGSLGGGGIGLAVLLVAGIALASFIRIRITIDWRGLRIVSLLLGIPLKRIPLDRDPRPLALRSSVPSVNVE